MAIKFNEEKQYYEVVYSKRHLITRVPVSRKRVGIKTKAQAKRVEAELIVVVNDLIKEKVIPKWVQIIPEFILFQYEKGNSAKYVEDYELSLRSHTLPDWADRRLDEITTMDVRKMIMEKLAHRSESRRKDMRKFLNGVFTYAVETGYLVKNPVPDMKFKIGDKLQRVLNEEQAKILLKQAWEMEVEWAPHWTMALYTGMRNGELYALTWDNVDLKKRTAVVNCSWNKTAGFKDTKSGDDRQIEIAKSLIPILKKLKAENADSNFVLPRIDRWDRCTQAHDLRMFLAGLGLPEVTFHDLRASWATITLSKGVAPIKVMRMGGWKDLKTMQRYIRKAGVDIRGITDSLDFT
jgi:integrase